MGGCCGAMKTGQKSLPENKQQKIDSENKLCEKEAIANTNNTVEDCNNKGEKVQLNHCETLASSDIDHDTAKAHELSNGLDQHALTSNSVPATALAPGDGDALSAEEEVATKIVTQAMEAALTETNGGNLDHQTSVAGSGVSEDEALNEWMKADTRNALVIDEPESAAQVELATAILPAFAAPGDVEIKVEENAQTSSCAAEVEPSIVEDLSAPVSSNIPPPLEQDVSQSVAVSEKPSLISEPVVATEPDVSDVESHTRIPTETNVASTEPYGQGLDNLEVESFPAVEEPTKFEEPLPEVALSEHFDSSITNPVDNFDNDAVLNQENVDNFDDEAVLNQENVSENQSYPDFVQDQTSDIPADLSIAKEPPQTLEESTDNFDSSNLPPPPPHDLLDEPSVSSPDFPELPSFDQVPAPVDGSTEQTIETQDLAEIVNEFESNDAVIHAAESDLNDLPPPSADPSDVLEPEVIPVLEEVVEQAKDQREQWWKEGQPELAPLVNGTNGTPDNEFIEKLQAASPDQEAALNNHAELSTGEEHLELPSTIKVAAVPNNQVPSLETEENGIKQDSSTEATVSAQA